MERSAERDATHGEFDESARVAQILKGIVRRSRNWAVMPAQAREAIDEICVALAWFLCGDWRFPDHVEAMLRGLEIIRRLAGRR